MFSRKFSLGVALLTLPLAAAAQPLQGPYISIGGGVDWHGDNTGLGGSTPSLGIAISGTSHNSFDTGGVGLAAVGYAIGNGLRFELEGAYRQHAVLKNSAGATYTGSERQYSLMVNAIYDLDLGLSFKPFVGAGAGVTIVSWRPVTRILNGIPCCTFFGSTLDYGADLVDVTNKASDSDLTYSVQAMAGVSYDIPAVPGLSMTVQYRFFDAPADITIKDLLYLRPETGTKPASAGSGTTKYGGHVDHSLIIGLTYAFNAPAPVAAAPVAAVPAGDTRSYIVFFDWNQADLTGRGKQIVAEAAANSAKMRYTKLEVNGYTDTSGTPGYNKGLSFRRAETVAAELVKTGVPKTAIAIQGFGETRLLVPTAQGVREPQNRRVEIVVN